MTRAMPFGNYVESLFPFKETNIIQSMNKKTFPAHRVYPLAGAEAGLRLLGRFALLCLPSPASADEIGSACAAYTHRNGETP